MDAVRSVQRRVGRMPIWWNGKAHRFAVRCFGCQSSCHRWPSNALNAYYATAATCHQIPNKQKSNASTLCSWWVWFTAASLMTHSRCQQRELTLNCLYLIAALSQASHATRWSLLSIDETDDGQSIDVRRFVATCMAIAQHFGRLLWLLGCIETIFDGTFDSRRLRSPTLIAWNGRRLSDEFT